MIQHGFCKSKETGYPYKFVSYDNWAIVFENQHWPTTYYYARFNELYWIFICKEPSKVVVK